MDGGGIRGRDLGVEGKRRNGEDAGEVFKMDTGGGLEDTRIHGEGGDEEEKAEDVGGRKGHGDMRRNWAEEREESWLGGA